MRGRTRFDPDQAWWQLAKILQNLCATDTLADHHRARIIDPVHLEYRLPNIQTNRANLAHGRLPSMWFALTQPPYGTSMPQSGRRPQHHLQTFVEHNRTPLYLRKRTSNHINPDQQPRQIDDISLLTL